MDDFKWFIGLLLVFGILWIGGRAREQRREAERKAPAPVVQTITATDTTPVVKPEALREAPVEQMSPEDVEEVVATREVSPLAGALSIGSVNRTAYDKEYVQIVASSKNKENIPITGLRLRSVVSLLEEPIGTGWSLYFPGISPDAGEPIVLRPGGRAYVLSGRSPLLPSFNRPNQGSFELNRCTGYLEQGYDFTPKLPLSCPRAIDEPLPLSPNHLSDDCLDYIETIKRCTVSTAVPERLRTDGSCQTFVFNRLNYNQCVATHKDEPTFAAGEWRVYLGRSNELWRDKREAIELLDEEGRVIDVKLY